MRSACGNRRIVTDHGVVCPRPRPPALPCLFPPGPPVGGPVHALAGAAPRPAVRLRLQLLGSPFDVGEGETRELLWGAKRRLKASMLQKGAPSDTVVG